MADRNDDAKTALLAWAYRYISEKGVIRQTGESTFYGSEELEFFSAAKRVIPDIAERAAEVHDHADLAVQRVMERQ